MVLALLFSLSSAFAEQAPPQVTNLKGCFAVSYRFVEDGAHDKEIKGSFELIEFESRADGSYYLQHYGVMDGEKQKHFGEEWKALADGRWHQTIYSPSGSYRYECKAQFIGNQYTCAVQDAPKPNRDRDRADYETLDRNIVLQITPAGWTQAENNIKRDENRNFVSNELGWIEYRRVDAKNCVETK